MYVLISYTQKYIVITESVGFWMQPLSSFEFLDSSLSNFAPKMSKALLGTSLSLEGLERQRPGQPGVHQGLLERADKYD